METIIQILLFITGTIILFYAGKQDNKTRNPLLLIPAIVLIGLSSNLATGLILTILSIIILLLPKQTNKTMGKADIFLFASIPIILILTTNWVLILILIISLTITLLLLFKLIIETPKKQRKTIEIPLIHYYAIAFVSAILSLFIASLIHIILIIIGVK